MLIGPVVRQPAENDSDRSFLRRLRQPRSSTVYNLKMMERIEGERRLAPPQQSPVTGICLVVHKATRVGRFPEEPIRKSNQ